MDTFTKDDLNVLAGDRAGICLSLYLNTDRTGEESFRNAIRLDNMLVSAEEQLTRMGMRLPDAKKMIEPARDLAVDKTFWQYQDKGLALFLTDGFFRSYRVPVACPELLVLSGRFHLKPLLPLLAEDIRFYLLALGRKSIRLFQGSRFTMEEITLPGIPQGIDEAVSTDQNEAFQQHHVRGRSGAGGETALFYGRGEGSDNDKDRVTRYFQRVNAGIQDFFADKNAPLIIAGVEYLLPLYRKANTFPGIIDTGITGSFDEESVKNLHDLAWPLVEPIISRRRLQARDEFHRLMGTGKASSVTQDIVPASFQGRVSTLLVSSRKQAWGTVDRANAGAISHLCREEEQGCEDLYDFAAIQTLLKGGEVFVVEEDSVTDSAPIAAIFRY